MNGSFYVFHVVAHHDAHEFLKRSGGRVPAKKGFGLGWVSQQLFNFGRAEIFGVHFHQNIARLPVASAFFHAFSLPFQLYSGLTEGQRAEFPDRVHFPGGDDEILRCVMLENQPHAFHVILGVTPAAQGVQVAQVKLVLHALGNACRRQRDFAGNEIFSAAFAFVVEQDAVNGKHIVRFPVILGNPESVLLGYAVG